MEYNVLLGSSLEYLHFLINLTFLFSTIITCSQTINDVQVALQHYATSVTVFYFKNFGTAIKIAFSFTIRSAFQKNKQNNVK